MFSPANKVKKKKEEKKITHFEFINGLDEKSLK